MKKISVLGSTGSIGTQTLDVVRKHPGKYRIVSLSCGHNTELLRKQLKEFSPLYASLCEPSAAEQLSREFPRIQFGYGMEGLCTAAGLEDSDITVNGLMGMMGLKPTLSAIHAGKDVAFANKETLVAGGGFIMDEVKKAGISFLPVDSEHSAIFQSLQGNEKNHIKRILLTASGGPFRGYTAEMMKSVTKVQALHHPRWVMGAKITIDSATMLNKGLEIIEASHLFSVPPKDIQVLVHPESILHSAVEYEDGAVIGQMGVPDMRVPIAYALSWPERLPDIAESLDLFGTGTLHFEEPDYKLFKCLALAKYAIEAGHSYQIVLNASNEEAVEAFLGDKISFTGIADVIEGALEAHKGIKIGSVEDIFAVEKEARRISKDIICRF